MNKKTIIVGKKIRNIRKDKFGLSMAEFGKLIDDKVQSGTVSNWEMGKNMPNAERLSKIAKLGKTNVNSLVPNTHGYLQINELDSKLQVQIHFIYEGYEARTKPYEGMTVGGGTAFFYEIMFKQSNEILSSLGIDSSLFLIPDRKIYKNEVIDEVEFSDHIEMFYNYIDSGNDRMEFIGETGFIGYSSLMLRELLSSYLKNNNFIIGNYEIKNKKEFGLFLNEVFIGTIEIP